MCFLVENSEVRRVLGHLGANEIILYYIDAKVCATHYYWLLLQFMCANHGFLTAVMIPPQNPGVGTCEANWAALGDYCYYIVGGKTVCVYK